MTRLLVAMLLFPAAGALLQAVAGRWLGRRLSGIAACLAVLGALLAAVAAMPAPGAAPVAVHLADWLRFGPLTVSASLLYDPLAGLMALTVTFVAFLIHVYSMTFMEDDKAWSRYFCYLNLFVAFMLVIALADDLLFLFVGWEGVGFCSYALIGFWHEKEANVAAGDKAFLTTRIGDLGYVAGAAILVALFGQASVTGLAANAALLPPGKAALLAFLFLLAALGKSAQLPLSSWLPDAMAGPTPVSALIHAATMVTAGVYLLVRLSPLLAAAPQVTAVIALIGGATALYGAVSALGQRDLKRVLAYSTISQVGYMFLAVGAGDGNGAMFHLASHAFFKSLLFMAAGMMIAACGDEHDIFRMGQTLCRMLPALYVLFFAGAASLAGLPPTAGYFSKGRIMADALAHPGWPYALAFLMAAAAAFLTALYIFRVLFVAFYGLSPNPTALTPSPALRRMAWPLWPLAVLAVLFGFINPPPELNLPAWLDIYLTGTAAAPVGQGPELAAEVLDAVLAVAGLLVAWWRYAPGRRPVPAAPGVLTAGFGLDALYLRFLAAPYRALARVWWRGVDEGLLDRSVNVSSGWLYALSDAMRRQATGKVSTSLAMLLATAAAALVWLAVQGG